MYPLDDTIAAVASPPGGAGRGILRVSGPEVVSCVEKVFRAEQPVELATIQRPAAIPGGIRLDEHGASLPCELYLWPTTRSYTGQPVGEIHTLGSPPLLDAVLRQLLESGARLAEPGEFTLRAFLSGRLDLTQAEAVLGVIDARGERQLGSALEQLAGGLTKPLTALRDAMADLLAHVEAGFDFSDEDLAFVSPDELTQQLATAHQTISGLIRKMISRTDVSELARVALTGWANTGKSSLFNCLVGKTGALVSDHAGTTRDYLTAELDLNGVKCILVDTAGINPDLKGPPDDVGRAAQAATCQQARQADVTVLCLDSTRPLNPWERDQLLYNPPGRLLVLTKCDASPKTDFSGHAMPTSSLTTAGITELRQRLAQTAVTVRTLDTEVVPGTAIRCRQSLRLAAGCLDRARALWAAGDGQELVAAEIRVALDELGNVVGAIYTEDLLDRVFSRFCVGK